MNIVVLKMAEDGRRDGHLSVSLSLFACARISGVREIQFSLSLSSGYDRLPAQMHVAATTFHFFS
jgi:hypothetical protein